MQQLSAHRRIKKSGASLIIGVEVNLRDRHQPEVPTKFGTGHENRAQRFPDQTERRDHVRRPGYPPIERVE